MIIIIVIKYYNNSGKVIKFHENDIINIKTVTCSNNEIKKYERLERINQMIISNHLWLET